MFFKFHKFHIYMKFSGFKHIAKCLTVNEVEETLRFIPNFTYSYFVVSFSNKG